ncbi:MAG: hypothetical protein ACRCUY_12840 [Thermoguttaceae bacterium]
MVRAVTNRRGLVFSKEIRRIKSDFVFSITQSEDYALKLTDILSVLQSDNRKYCFLDNLPNTTRFTGRKNQDFAVGHMRSLFLSILDKFFAIHFFCHRSPFSLIVGKQASMLLFALFLRSINVLKMP